MNNVMGTNQSSSNGRVRMATMHDMAECVEKGRQMTAAVGWHSFDPDDAEVFLEHLINEGAVFLSSGGILGASLCPVPWNSAHITAVEHFWWSTDGHGLGLIRAFEDWAFTRAHDIAFSTINYQLAVSKIMERRGYELRECAWVKRVGG